MKQIPAPPECDVLLKRWKDRISAEAKLAFSVAFIVGMLTHLYMFTGKYPNHDEVMNLYAPNNAFYFGRWLLKAATFFSSDSGIPLVTGMIGIVAVSVACALVVRMLRIQKRSQIAVIAVLMVTFPTLANTFSWMHCSDGFLIAIGLAVLGAYVTDRSPKGWNWCGGGVLFVASLAIYQAQICVAIALLAVRYLQRLLEKESSDREMLLLLGRYAAAVLGGLIVYIVLARWVVPAATGVQLASHAGLDTMGSMRLSELPRRVFDAYYQFAQYFLRTSMLVSWRYIRYLHMAIGAASGIMLLAALFRGRKAGVLQTVFALLIMAMLPMLLGSIYLTGAQTEATYYLMIYSYVFFYILLIVAYNAFARTFDQACSNAGAWVKNGMGYVTLVMALWIGLVNGVCDNELYLALQLKYENCYALANRVILSLEQYEAYDNQTPVYIAGWFSDGNYSPSKEVVFQSLSRYSGMQTASEYNLIYTDGLFHAFARDYIGVILETADDAQVAAALATEEYSGMPSYPRDGSIRLINGIVIVKAAP